MLQSILLELPGRTVFSVAAMVCKRWARIAKTTTVTSFFALEIRFLKYNAQILEQEVRMLPDVRPFVPENELDEGGCVQKTVAVHPDGRLFVAVNEATVIAAINKKDGTTKQADLISTSVTLARSPRW